MFTFFTEESLQFTLNVIDFCASTLITKESRDKNLRQLVTDSGFCEVNQK